MKWATVSMLMEKVDAKNFNALAEYMSRFDLTFRVLFFRSVLVRNPEFRTDAFRQKHADLSGICTLEGCHENLSQARHWHTSGFVW